MDSLITASARALAAGDALGALKRVALRDDPPALALRGIAMAQLGDHVRARLLLRRAARGFGPHEALARARCVVAEAEVALAMRELGGSVAGLAAAAATLEQHGDHSNAALAWLIAARRLLLLGRLAEASVALQRLDAWPLPAALLAVAELAQAALDRAQRAADHAAIPALQAEASEMQRVLARPAARRLVAGTEQALRLDEVATLLASGALIVDGCRRGLQAGPSWVPLARRPLLFTLVRALATAWPAPVDREVLIEDVFRTRPADADDSHRARLRVEIGRLRALIGTFARIDASASGFVLRPHADRSVVLLAPPIAGEQAALLALLGDGAAWSTSALALALDASQRTVQRALVELQARGQVRSIGVARSQRWLAPPLSGFTTILLLPVALALA